MALNAMERHDPDFFVTKSASKQHKKRSNSECLALKRKPGQACTECRKKKVRCDGISPCNPCKKTDKECYFVQTVKKEPTKHTIESQATKLKRLKETLVQLSIMIDHTKPPEAPLFSSLSQTAEIQLGVQVAGQASYLPDSCLRTDRIPRDPNESWETLIREIQPKEDVYMDEPIHEHLLNIYFQYIDPLLPILHKPSFFHQLQSNQPISCILLNAMYCVSSRWDMSIPVREDEPRGWGYYEYTITLLNQQNEPRLSTVQALLLLLKYNEHVRRPGFLWRARYYFQMIVRMCKDLGLQREILVNNASSSVMIEIEKRKRTFWAVYCYDVMMSIENGAPFHFDLQDPHVDDPSYLADEAEEQEKIVHFILLTHIVRSQAQITTFLRRKLDSQCKVTNFLTCWKEEEEFEQLTHSLKTSIGMVTSLTHFPHEDDMCYSVCFLYLASCFATISLHRPFAFQKTEQSSPHTGHCAEAAFNIRRIIGLIFRCEAFEDMYCSIRGIHQIMHYISAAITVFKEGGYESELEDLMRVATYLASASPVTEMMRAREKVKRKNSTRKVSLSTPEYNNELQTFEPMDFTLPIMSNNQSLASFMYNEDDYTLNRVL